jgi:hypothetical protein
MTRTNRHLLCAYYFTSYAYYIYIAVPIQQGTDITDLLIYYFWGTIMCHIFGLPGYTNILLVLLLHLAKNISNCNIVLSIYYKICVCVLISIVLVLSATFTSLAKATSLSIATYSGDA